MVLKVKELYFCYILLVKASHKTSPDSKREEIGLMCPRMGEIGRGHIWRLSPCRITLSIFLICFLKVVLLVFRYIKITHENYFFIPPTRITFLLRVQATDIIAITLVRESLILGICEVCTGNNK